MNRLIKHRLRILSRLSPIRISHIYRFGSRRRYSLGIQLVSAVVVSGMVLSFYQFQRAEAQITLIQEVTSTCGNAASPQTCTATISAAVTDNLIVAVCSGRASGGGPPTLGGPSGFTSAVGPTTINISAQEIYYKVSTGGETSVACTVTRASTNVSGVITVLEYSGMATSTVVDVTNNNTGNSTTASTTGVTTTNAQDLIIAGATSEVGSTSMSGWTDSFTEQAQGSVGAVVRSATADRTVSSTGSYDPDVTVGSGNWIMQLAAFKGDGTGANYPELTQEAYIFENDDGGADAGTQLAGSEFSSGTTLSQVPRGQRLVLRMQLTNSGTAPLASADEIGLFYDRGDGLWAPVGQEAVQVSGSGCALSDWDCETIDSTDDTGYFSSIAFDQSNQPIIAYYDETDDDLWVARYVGSDGNGCNSSQWTCEAVITSGSVGAYSAVAVDQAGMPWVAYRDVINGDLEAARYVGSGGSGCASSAWTCTLVDATDDIGTDISIAIDGSGSPAIAYHDATNGNLEVAEYVGSAGNCDSVGGGSDAWECTTIISTDDIGEDTSIAFDPDDNAYISYYDVTNADLTLARFVGSGGSGCASGAWTCADIYTSGDAGENSSIAFAPDGEPWISFYHNGDDDLIAAEYVGGGSGSGCASSDWTCTSVITSGEVGAATSLGFSPAGQPMISYRDVTNNDLEYAIYMGSGGSGCASSAWSCAAVLSSGSAGEFSSLVLDHAGQPWIAHALDSSGDKDLAVARLIRRGEVIMSGGLNANGDTISESHADMTSATDSSNRDDADCVAGSTTWNNGKWFEGGRSLGLTIAKGSTTKQCSEVSWVIDTSQLQPEVSYRFVAATKDGWRTGRDVWRGPVSLQSMPQLSASAHSDIRFAKDGIIQLPDCDDTDWGCEDLTSTSTDPTSSEIGVSPNGTMWIAYYDTSVSARDLKVARYVGSGGGTGDCVSAEWECTVIDSDLATGEDPKLTFGPDGNPWISYDIDNTSLGLARYVGSGGTGCALSSWNCEVIDNTVTVSGSDIAINSAGNAYISYWDTTNDDIKIAYQVADGGSGCGTGIVGWRCETVEDVTNLSSDETRIALDQNGRPYIIFIDAGANDDLYVASYVGGSGGSGCTNAGWSCLAVYDAGVEQGPSIGVDSSGNPWITWNVSAGGGLYVGEYVGSGGSGCAAGVTSWDCTQLQSGTNMGASAAIAFDVNGDPWVSYNDQSNSDLEVARFVGSGGSGCTSGAWTCEQVDTATASGAPNSIAFDQSGVPWITYSIGTAGSREVRIAKLHLPLHKLSQSILNVQNGKNAVTGDALFRLTDGRSPYASAAGDCGGISNLLGYCGVYHSEGSFDQLVDAAADMRPLYTFAVKYSSNGMLPAPYWSGQTNVAPSTAGAAGDLYLQVYRFGSTNAWDTIDSDTASSDCSSADCVLEGQPSGTTADYFESDGSDYWVYYRVYQVMHTSAITLKTDGFKAPQTQQQLRHGALFSGGVKQPLNWR